MDLRKRLFIIIGVVLGIIIVIILFFLFFNKKQGGVGEPVVPAEAVSTDTTESGSTDTPALVEPVATLPQESADQIYVRQLARIFVERSGSFSSQNNNVQLDDVSGIVTPRLAAWLEQNAAEQKSLYEGTTTRVVTTSNLTVDGDKASVRLGVQMEKRTNGTSKTEYRNGRVDMIKIGTEWKVDGLFWDK